MAHGMLPGHFLRSCETMPALPMAAVCQPLCQPLCPCSRIPQTGKLKCLVSSPELDLAVVIQNPLVHISLIEGWWQATPTVRGGQQTVFEWAKINLCSLKKKRKKGFGELLPSVSLVKRTWCAEKNGSGGLKKNYHTIQSILASQKVLLLRKVCGPTGIQQARTPSASPHFLYF